MCLFCENFSQNYHKKYADAERSGILSKRYSYPVKIVSKGIDKRAKLCYNEKYKENNWCLSKSFLNTIYPEEWRCWSHLHSFSLHGYILPYFSSKFKRNQMFVCV